MKEKIYKWTVIIQFCTFSNRNTNISQKEIVKIQFKTFHVGVVIENNKGKKILQDENTTTFWKVQNSWAG
jgi:myo-inositol-hexaphosphate 3-phosphohydrolase